MIMFSHLIRGYYAISGVFVIFSLVYNIILLIEAKTFSIVLAVSESSAVSVTSSCSSYLSAGFLISFDLMYLQNGFGFFLSFLIN